MTGHRIDFRRPLLAAAVAAAICGAHPVAAETAGRALSLPSAPGPTVQRIRAMKPGAWLDLGRPAPDPEWGHARGRAWTSKMAYSAALGGAFLFGEGIHGWFNRDNGRYMDGLWLYDVNRHRWVNLHPGTDTRSPLQPVVTKDGFEGLAEDRPVPMATMVHGYEMTAWDPHRQLFFAMPNHHAYYAKALPALAEFRRINADKLNRNAASPWMFDPWNRRWHRLRTAGRSPRSGYGHVLAYLPKHKRLFFYNGKRVAHYDPDRTAWTYPQVAGPPPPFGIDPTACHDPARDRLYIGGGIYPVAKGPNAFWIYDASADMWVDPKPAGSPGANHFGTNEAVMTCDTARDRVMLFRHKGAARGLYVYDAKKNAWRDRRVGLPAAWPDNRVVNGFFDPGLGVHFMYVSRDSHPDGRMFVYRPD